LFFDISDCISIQNKEIDLRKDAFNVPFSIQPQGSSFGDEDALKSLILS
jgi:hypothetical protein